MVGRGGHAKRGEQGRVKRTHGAEFGRKQAATVATSTTFGTCAQPGLNQSMHGKRISRLILCCLPACPSPCTAHLDLSSSLSFCSSSTCSLASDKLPEVRASSCKGRCRLCWREPWMAPSGKQATLVPARRSMGTDDQQAT